MATSGIDYLSSYYSSYYNNYNTNSLTNLYSNALSSSSSSKKNSIYGNYNLYDVVNQKYYNKSDSSSSAASSAASVKELGKSLLEAVNALTNKSGKSVFDQMSAASSNDKLLTATVDSSKVKDYSSLKNTKYELQIDKIAKSQVNSGDGVKATDKALSTGSYSFAIDIGGKSQTFSINVTYSDTNESIQNKMAEAINKKNVGVTASVSYNSTDKTTKLSIESNDTGTKDESQPVFTIRDISGNAASKMGITNTSQQAQNAVYSVNGGEKQVSRSNDVEIASGITATLNGTTAGSETVSLTFKQGTTDSINAVRNFVNAVNESLEAANDGSGKRMNALSSAISGMIKTYGSSLSKIGISINSSGYLAIDSDKMQKAADSGEIQKLFQGDKGYSNYGLVNRAQKIGTDMANAMYSSTESYSNYSSMSSSYFSSVYNKYSNYSSLFDLMF